MSTSTTQSIQSGRTAHSGLLLDALTALASLRLTVTLFALSLFLIYAGTLAQVQAGIWSVMEDYFRTLIAWIEIRPLSFGYIDSDAVFPYPGGFLLGALLLVNLLAAHLMRFQISWKRSGILMIHTGLIVLILSEFVTGLAAEEGQMTIWEGGISNFVEDIREVELAVIDVSEPQFDHVVAIPESRISDADGLTPITIEHADLPFVVRVDRFMLNSQLVGVGGLGRTQANPATSGTGLEVVPIEREPISGTDPNQKANNSSAFVTLLDRESGRPLQTVLVSRSIAQRQIPQIIQHSGRIYHLFLRFKRTYKPYAIALIDFRHERYPGTDKPKTFESHIRLYDPSHGEDRAAVIRMNQPLRYGGETFFQAAFKEGDQGTVLQVVDNPGWLMPYISCSLITLGLVVHFLMSMGKFMNRQATRVAGQAGAP
jgi:hypothetical protein